MKFTVERDVLADAVAWVARALPARPPMPVLSGVRITAEAKDGGRIILASFDYEVSARVEIAADVDQEGESLVSGRLLADITRLLPGKPVNLGIEGPKVIVTCGSSTFTLPTMPLDDYPSLPAMPTHVGAVDAGSFAEAVSQVQIAASRDETLPLLTGIRMEIDGDKIVFLSTDRYRLALRELNWKPSQADISSVALVRARTLTDVAKSFGSTEEVALALASGSTNEIIGFESEGKHTTSLLVDGDYPQVRKLLPESSPIHAVVEVSALIEATKRVSLVAERNTPVRLSFSEGQVTLDAGAGDDAQASDVLPASLEGEDIVVAFNPTYLLDGLNAINAPFVHMALSHPNKPVLFTAQREIDSDPITEYQYLLVPIRFAG